MDCLQTIKIKMYSNDCFDIIVHAVQIEKVHFLINFYFYFYQILYFDCSEYGLTIVRF
jgi:hypothetical protein